MVDRIAEMEEILDRLNEDLPLLEKLIEYYGSDEFQEDFLADEEGLLPKDLKRGVLSEDGINDLLLKLKEMLAIC